MKLWPSHRQVPKPELVTARQSANPLFPAAGEDPWAKYRRQVIGSTLGVIILLFVAWAAYGPAWRINRVEVAGTRLVVPVSVQRATETYIQGTAWLIIPRRTSWLLSSNDLSHWLTKRISARLSIEGVTIKKIGRHTIRVTVIERVPAFVWTDGTSFGTMDRHGIIIENVAGDYDPGLVRVNDASKTPFQVNELVVQPEVVDRMIELQGLFRTARIDLDHLVIPEASCPVRQVVNSNSNVNAATNINAAPVIHQPVTINVNDISNVNAPNCDLSAERRQSQEMHVQVRQGPLVMFDRHENISRAVDSLKTLLAQPENQHAQYIDLRFEQRVYIYP